MSQSDWQKIQSNYNEYLQRYPDEGMVSAKLDYPLQSSALLQGGYAGNNQGQLERELLIKFDESLPEIENFPPDIIYKLPIELMNILKIQVTSDHQKFWKWTFWILEDVNQQKSIFPEELVTNLETLVRLTTCSPIPSVTRESGQHPKTFADENWNAKGHEAHIISRSKYIAAYLSYPLLEGIIKSVCSDDIKMNGEIKSGKQIKEFAGGYSRRVCYRLCDLLTHLEEEYADDQFQTNLQEMRIAIGDFWHRNPNQIYKIIDSQRNTSLHGQNAPDAEYGTILNLLCLIIWNEMKPILE